MLYDCWLQIVRARRSDMAVLDLGSGQRWTFGELAAATGKPGARGQVIFPSGNSAGFVLEVLKGWQSGSVVCPLEAGQAAPGMKGPLPPGTVHLKTTSATTVTPRLVAFTASQLKADVDNIVATMGLRAEWPNVGLISLAHSYGFSNLVLPLLLHGIPLVLVPGGLPQMVREAAEAVPDVTFAGVPALWRAWHASQVIPGNLRLAISAGAALPVELERQVFERWGVKIHNFYGSSECGGIAYDASSRPRPDGAYVGQPIQNVDVRLAEDRCVEVRGAAVGETYWPEPSPNLKGGVFRTSDLGEFREGALWLRGRACDQINVAGRKVVPEAIEQVLSAHPQVGACIVFGVPGTDPQRGETIVACVARCAGLSADALKQHALAHLPAWQVPRRWWFVESLTVNQRGKISRAEWRKRFLERGEPGAQVRELETGILETGVKGQNISRD